MGPAPTQKAPVSTSARTASSNRREFYTKQGLNPPLVSGHSPGTLKLPSRQPTMAWVLARHGSSSDMSGAHVINHHLHDSSQNNGHTIQHHRHLPIQQTPLSWVDWKKEIHRQRDIIAQSRCTPAAASSITTNSAWL